MRWIDALVDDLRPWFGGIPTFVEDPDHLLDLPQVREAVRASGMTLGDWDGDPVALAPFKAVDETDMPLLVVGDGAQRHIVTSCLTDYRWEVVSIGTLMPKFAPDVVTSIPTERWDALLTLHEQVRQSRAPQETALLIGRALYGVDPEFLKHGDGWMRLLTRIAVADDPLPVPIARAVIDTMPPPRAEIAQPETLSDTANARTALSALIAANPILYDQASRAEQLLLAELRPAYPASPCPAADVVDLLCLWEEAGEKPQGVLQFGLAYAQAQSASRLPDALRNDINGRFVAWLKHNYGLLQSNLHPAVLRLPTLLKTLDAELDGQRAVLFVVDSLSLAAWDRVRQRWIADGVISSADTRAAFAIVPTLTRLSRRALFEGKPPSQFSAEQHSQRLERKLWANRYHGQGTAEYFAAEEAVGFADSLAKGTFRICVMDVSWDKRGHSIDPRTDSISDAANVWARRTPLRGMMLEALAAGYRVVLTADHGQVECIGKGRLNVGALSEERSKRVMLFNDKSVCNAAMRDWTDNFRPEGSPQNVYPLFATDFHSFDLTGAATVSHGGLSIEEVLVPVVEVHG